MTKAQIASLFELDEKRIAKYIQSILKNEELDPLACVKDVLIIEGYNTKLYNLEMIISIGYRVNVKRIIEFRRWVYSILKDSLYKKYAINNKTTEIQNENSISSISNDSLELTNVITKYEKALDLLDDYDHQRIHTVKGKNTIYRLTYEECRKLIDSMKFTNSSTVFGIEKEAGKLNGILEAVYQNVFGEEVYKSLESKAAHLLYFLVKDHPFVDGCKRIAATIFLEFLNKNNALFHNGKFIISNDGLAAITLLTAESNPNDMELIINIIINLLSL